MAVRFYDSTDAGAPVLNGTAGSMITFLDAILVNGYGSKPSLGWTKEFSGTNKAVYRQAVGSNRFYLRVDDTGTGAFGPNVTAIRGYESMTSVDVGTNPFPTVAQMADGRALYKSPTQDSTARSWFFVGDEGAFYFIPKLNSIRPFGIHHFFGDIKTSVVNDAYHCVMVCPPVQNTTSESAMTELVSNNLIHTDVSGNFFIARKWNQIGSSQNIGILQNGLLDWPLAIGGSSQRYALTNPTNKIEFLKVWIIESGTPRPLRGTFPGLYTMTVDKEITDDSNIINPLNLPGRTIRVKPIAAGSNVQGGFPNNWATITFDITGPWR